MAEYVKDILRPQWDSRKQMWKIVKKTFNGCGGWANFSDITYPGRNSAQDIINIIVEKNPELYEKE